MDLMQFAPQNNVIINIFYHLLNANQSISMHKTFKYPAQELVQVEAQEAIYQQVVSLLLAVINVFKQQQLVLTTTIATCKELSQPELTMSQYNVIKD
jgi:hypothetical protein